MVEYVGRSPLFPYTFVFRSRTQLNEHIPSEFTNDGVVYYPKLVSGLITLILPLFNVFTIYRNVIHQREDFDDAYSVFHSIAFYGEFIELHFLIFISFVYLIYFNGIWNVKINSHNFNQWFHFSFYTN
jgi:hypothetical protein